MPDLKGKEIQQLKLELEEAREDVISLMPENIRELLYGCYECESRRGIKRWLKEVAKKVIGYACPVELSNGRVLTDRAKCPLCGKGSTSVYQHGFALPEGLNRHLRGESKANECVVMKTARQIAIADLRERMEKKDSELL